MIWNFDDGTEYESAYAVDGLEYKSAQEVGQAIISKFQDARVLQQDPVAKLEQMYRQAAEDLDGTERAKAAYLDSALRRVERMGKGILLSVFRNNIEYRLIVTRTAVSILKPIATDDELPSELATIFSGTLGGTARKLVY